MTPSRRRRLRAPHLVLLALLLAAMTTSLAAMGRPWWCGAGDASLWSGDVWSRHNSQHLVDPYSITHVLHGIGLYGVLWFCLRRFTSPAVRALLAVGVEITWEVVENTNAMIERYRAATISLDYYGDSIANSLGDVASFTVGYFAASVLPVWLSVAGFVVVDGLLVLWIRDSLALNILMLIHPIDAVKAWQAGGAQRP